MVPPGGPTGEPVGDGHQGDGQYSFCVSARSGAPPGTVFDLLADAPGWRRWAGPMIRRSSWERGTGAEGSIRRLGRPPVVAREQIVVSEAPSHHAYVQLSGIPMHRYRADVHLSERDGGTIIEWCGSFDAAIPGSGPLLRLALRRTVAGFARHLAAAAEARTAGDA